MMKFWFACKVLPQSVKQVISSLQMNTIIKFTDKTSCTPECDTLTMKLNDENLYIRVGDVTYNAVSEPLVSTIVHMTCECASDTAP